MMLTQTSVQRAVGAAALVAGLLGGGFAHAENHALIMWIGDYGNPKMNLPGIDQDAANAKRIARAMGVTNDRNIREVSNANLTKRNIATELADLQRRIATGDKVFIYYSGHGAQVRGVGGARCTEALVSRDPDLYPDFELQEALTSLGSKASQVVVLNDSCFSGGAATKDLGARANGNVVPKFYSGDVKGNTAISGDYQCGNAVNKMARNLEPVAARTNVLYVAAASDNEVAFASEAGSIATQAWASCLASGQADSNRSGGINGRELQKCSQAWISNARYRQTVMLQGDADLPLVFPASSSGGAGRVDAASALHDIRAGASKEYQVSLVPRSNTMRIGQDAFDFSVSSNRSGYLYILQVGSDGETFNLLFPNQLDSNNQIKAGTHQFPRASWRVRSGGPAGTSHLLAVLTQTPIDLSKGMDMKSSFPTTKATGTAAKTLYVEASGGNGGSGAFGASAVVSINETN